VPLDVAIAYLKQCGIWIGEVPQQTKIIVLAGVGLAILLLVLVVAASRGCHGSSTAADAGETFETTVAAVEAETPAPPAKQPDALMTRVPVPTTPVLLPAPADATAETAKEATDVKPAEQVDYTTEVSMPDAPEIPPETNLGGPPDGYEELIGRGETASSQRNFTLAMRKFKAATELWPEGARGWRRLGDTLVILGERSKAKTAYQEYLRLAPDASDAGFIRRLVERW
jgi:tetratricopeptide (TPR) repeat protein